jgi:uncharacterized membrane protein
VLQALGATFVSARFLLRIFDSAYLLALTAWIGSLFSYLLVLTPVVAKLLSAEDARTLQNALLRRCFTWGSMAGAIALPAFVAVPLSFPEYRGPGIAIQSVILLACILVMLYGANSLAPAMNNVRKPGPAEIERFRQLHRRSLVLGASVLAAVFGLLIAHANRPVARTSGLPQLTAAEQARFDAELGPIIEQVETKYGFRAGPQAGETAVSPGRSLDQEAIKEIESYYEQKRQRELARKGQTAVVPPAAGNQ